MIRTSTICFAAAFALLAWAAHAIVFNPPMLLTAGTSTSVIDLGTATGGNGASSAKVTVGPGGVPAGSTIVVLIQPGSGPGSVNNVIDTASNTYTRQNFVSYDSGVLYSAMYVCQNCTALIPGNTITLSLNAGSGVMSALAIKTTQATSLDLNTTPVSSGGSKITNPTITSGTPSTAGEIFIGGLVFVAVSPASTMVQATGGWQQPLDFSTTSSSSRIGGGWLKNAGTGTVTYNPTLSAANFTGIFLMSFKL